jgi:hypothetical protein
MTVGMHIEPLPTTVARSSIQGELHVNSHITTYVSHLPLRKARLILASQPRVVIAHSHGQGEITGEALFKHYSPVDDWTEHLTVIRLAAVDFAKWSLRRRME